jgi:hypothetical protein
VTPESIIHVKYRHVQHVKALVAASQHKFTAVSAGSDGLAAETFPGILKRILKEVVIQPIK